VGRASRVPLGSDGPHGSRALIREGHASYAALLHAREYLRTKLRDPNLFAKSKGVHAAVIAVLRGNHSTVDEKLASTVLDGLRDRRRVADYELRPSKRSWPNEAADSVSEADEVFRLLP
jgi:hypothetical protein